MYHAWPPGATNAFQDTTAPAITCYISALVPKNKLAELFNKVGATKCKALTQM